MLNLKDIKKNITLIKKARKVMDQRIHETAVSIMAHASEHGDYSQMNELFLVLPNSARLEGFKVWVCDHSPLHFDAKVGLFIKARNNKTEYHVEKADATPFWKYTVETVKALNVDNLLD